jgi:hypothetical protein
VRPNNKRPASENRAGVALPNAKIVHDEFHLSKHHNGAMDKVHKAENPNLMIDVVPPL